jgi:hypothetical protein
MPEDQTITLAEQYFTHPAIDRRLPDESIGARAALHIVESETMLDGDSAVARGSRPSGMAATKEGGPGPRA